MNRPTAQDQSRRLHPGHRAAKHAIDALPGPLHKLADLCTSGEMLKALNMARDWALDPTSDSEHVTRTGHSDPTASAAIARVEGRQDGAASLYGRLRADLGDLEKLELRIARTFVAITQNDHLPCANCGTEHKRLYPRRSQPTMRDCRRCYDHSNNNGHLRTPDAYGSCSVCIAKRTQHPVDNPGDSPSHTP